MIQQLPSAATAGNQASLEPWGSTQATLRGHPPVGIADRGSSLYFCVGDRDAHTVYIRAYNTRTGDAREAERGPERVATAKSHFPHQGDPGCYPWARLTRALKRMRQGKRARRGQCRQ